MSDEIQERFFYHSFPRRGRDTQAEITKGCEILTSIRDFGLLLTPEITKWQYPHADGSPPREQQIPQRTACFTELSVAELQRHAKEFGNFALDPTWIAGPDFAIENGGNAGG